MPENPRESSDEFASADRAAEACVANIFFLMRFSKRLATKDVLELFTTLSQAERTRVMHKLNTMRNPTEKEMREIRRSLILLLTPKIKTFFAPQTSSPIQPKMTRFPDEILIVTSPQLTFA